jgi:hypothetical protein
MPVHFCMQAEDKQGATQRAERMALHSFTHPAYLFLPDAGCGEGEGVTADGPPKSSDHFTNGSDELGCRSLRLRCDCGALWYSWASAACALTNPARHSNTSVAGEHLLCRRSNAAISSDRASTPLSTQVSPMLLNVAACCENDSTVWEEPAGSNSLLLRVSLRGRSFSCKVVVFVVSARNSRRCQQHVSW